METVKLANLLRDRQDQEHNEALFQAERMGCEVADIGHALHDVDVDRLADRVLAGLRVCHGFDSSFLDRIDVASLEMYDDRACVVGQAFGWHYGIDRLVAFDQATKDEDDLEYAHDEWVIEHGFDITGYDEVTFQDLGIAWELAILNVDRLEQR